jgi:hypothetical protein
MHALRSSFGRAEDGNRLLRRFVCPEIKGFKETADVAGRRDRAGCVVEVTTCPQGNGVEVEPDVRHAHFLGDNYSVEYIARVGPHIVPHIHSN